MQTMEHIDGLVHERCNFIANALELYLSCTNPLILPCGHFYYHGLTLIPAWISNYIHYNVWDEITYPFLNFNGATVEV